LAIFREGTFESSVRLCVLDVPPDDNENIEHSNVIPVLPVQSRDLVKTRTVGRRRREAPTEDAGSRGHRLLVQRSSGEQAMMRDDAAAAILVSHYVTGQHICISFTYKKLCCRREAARLCL